MLKKDIYNKTGMLMGVLGAFLTYVALILVFNFSKHPFEIFKFFSLSIPFLLVFLTAMYFRVFKQEIELKFGHIMRMSWWIILLTAALFSTAYSLYIIANEKEFYDTYIEFMESFIRSSNVEVFEKTPIEAAEKLKLSLEEARKMTVSSLVFNDLISKVLAGSLASLIVSIILRK